MTIKMVKNQQRQVVNEDEPTGTTAYSLDTGASAMPVWDISGAYDNVTVIAKLKASGKDADSNDAKTDGIKVMFTLTCGSETISHEATAKADGTFDNINIPNTGTEVLTVADFGNECTVTAKVGSANVTGNIAWDVIVLGMKLDPALTATNGTASYDCDDDSDHCDNCDDIDQLIVAGTRGSETLEFAPLEDGAGTTHVVDNDPYDGGCSIGNVPVVGIARKALPSTVAGTCWDADPALAGNKGTAAANDCSGNNKYNLDNNGRLWAKPQAQ